MYLFIGLCHKMRSHKTRICHSVAYPFQLIRIMNFPPHPDRSFTRCSEWLHCNHPGQRAEVEARAEVHTGSARGRPLPGRSQGSQGSRSPHG